MIYICIAKAEKRQSGFKNSINDSFYCYIKKIIDSNLLLFSRSKSIRVKSFIKQKGKVLY